MLCFAHCFAESYRVKEMENVHTRYIKSYYLKIYLLSVHCSTETLILVGSEPFLPSLAAFEILYSAGRHQLSIPIIPPNRLDL